MMAQPRSMSLVVISVKIFMRGHGSSAGLHNKCLPEGGEPKQDKMSQGGCHRFMDTGLIV